MRLRAGLYALLTVTAVTAVVLAAFGQWYHDDACTIEQWRCSAGTLALTQFYFGLVSAVLALLWVVAAAASSLLGQKPRGDGNTHRRDLLRGMLSGGVLLAVPWLVWALSEVV